MKSLNLVTSNWIKVLKHDGSIKLESLPDLIRDSINTVDFAYSNPMDRFALFRFVLAVIIWIRSKNHIMGNTLLSEAQLQELVSHSPLFSLYGEPTRFYQTNTVLDIDRLSINYLRHEIPTGSNLNHFCHSTDMEDGLCYSCVALGLLRLPVFSTSGGRGKPPGINKKPPVYLLPGGKSLEQQLNYSIGLIEVGSEVGTPSWENPLTELPLNSPVPPLVGLTWLPRRIWLSDPDKSIETCCQCGTADHLIKSCVFAGIPTNKNSDEDGPVTIWKDPHVFYDPKDNKALYSVDSGSNPFKASSQWLSFYTAGIAKFGGIEPPSTIKAIAFTSVKNDKYVEALHYNLEVKDSTTEVVERVEKSQSVIIKKLEGILKRNNKEQKAFKAVADTIRCDGAIRIHTLMTQPINEIDLLNKPLITSLAISLNPELTIDSEIKNNQIARIINDTN